MPILQNFNSRDLIRRTIQNLHPQEETKMKGFRQSHHCKVAGIELAWRIISLELKHLMKNGGKHKMQLPTLLIHLSKIMRVGKTK
jgi:hypothetical protein